MLESSYKKYETVPFAINLVVLVAFLGILMTVGQVALIVLSGDILCLNDGCEIVESLTTVPPIVFNLAGAAYFFTLFICFFKGRKGTSTWLNLGRLLLLCGMAAEGVLVSFQHYIAGVFCSYCLIILGTICILNLFVGLRQFFKGFCIFISVVIAFSSLEFKAAQPDGSRPLTEGTRAVLEGQQNDAEIYLFFSATCPHCEEVIATLDEEFLCTVNFNPVGEVPEVAAVGMEYKESYSPEVNKQFLKNLGISEIPTLAVMEKGEVAVLTGKSLILEYLDGQCRPVAEEIPAMVPQEPAEGSYDIQMSGQSSISSSPYYLPPPAEDESCGVDIDCEPVQQ